MHLRIWKRLNAVVILGFTVAMLFSSAVAQAHGRLRDVDTLGTYWEDVIIPANVAEHYEVIVDSSSPGGDPVIHVMTYSASGGGPIAGNDDCTPTTRNSCVDIPPSPSQRVARIFVRAFSTASGGFGDPCNAKSQIPFQGNIVNLNESLPAKAHVLTTRQNRGDADPNSNAAANDTMFLVFSWNDPKTALIWDDDDGVGSMSWAHLDVACPNCAVVMLTANQFRGMTTSLGQLRELVRSASQRQGLRSGRHLGRFRAARQGQLAPRRIPVLRSRSGAQGHFRGARLAGVVGEIAVGRGR
jgi:hypothetical protein